MSWMQLLSAVIAVGLLVYLIAALIAAEKL